MTDWTRADIPDQTGRTVLITGANSGLGLASAETLAAKGAQVLMACRNETKGLSALDQVSRAATGEQPRLIALDLADLASVEACAAEVSGSVDHLDVLMNNAGIMAVPKGRTADGFESQFGTNHLGHFALTGRMLPLLLQAQSPRVVTTSSGVHKGGRMRWDDVGLDRRYGKWRAYAQSKLANLLFMLELDRRAASAGSSLASVGAHPGYASTHLQAVGPELSGSRLMARAMDLGNSVFAQTAEDGALPQLRAATDPAARGSEYYGPDGIGEMRGSPEVVRPNSQARDPQSARRLWELSEQLTGVTYDWG